MDREPIPQPLLNIAQALVPDADLGVARLARGQFHDVVLLENVAAVRIARRPEAARELTRRTAVVTALSELDLSFAVPAALTPVTVIDGTTAVATAWIPGAALPRQVGDPSRLAELLAALREVPTACLAGLLDEPHAYAGRAGWFELMHTEVIPRLDASVRDEARRRIDSAHALPDVEPSLVHGDLGGHNLHWSSDGQLLGVLDWDLAQAFDPAIDAACLAWHGWDNVRKAVDTQTYGRARTWYATFGLEQAGSALCNGEPDDVITKYLESTTHWIRRTSSVT